MLDIFKAKVPERKYRVLKKLHEDETTALFAGEHTNISGKLLIKVFKPEHAWPSGAPHRHRRFKMDGICNSEHDAASMEIQQQRLYYVVMRQPEGASLKEELEAGRLDPDRLDQILAQVSRILEAARKKNQVHEGLASSNIWIDRDENVLLLDFDFAPLAKPHARWPRYVLPLLVVVSVALVFLLRLRQQERWPFAQPTQTAPPTEWARPTQPPTATHAPRVSLTPDATPIAVGTRKPPWSTPTRPPTATLTPTPVRTPLAWNSRQTLKILTAPGWPCELSAELEPGVQVELYGCTKDRRWWQVEYIGQKGWVSASSAVSNLYDPCARVRVVDPTPFPTATPSPTAIELPLPTPTVEPELVNPTFDGLKPNQVPGWHRWATDNCPDGRTCTSEMYDKPLYKEADDPEREINGSTLQIDATGFVHFRAGLYQIVSVPPGSTVQATIQARAFSSHGSIRVHIGLDANGLPNCDSARWGPHADLNQSIPDPVTLITNQDQVGSAGLVTVCLFAETSHAAHSNAAFFDDATLEVYPR